MELHSEGEDHSRGCAGDVSITDAAHAIAKNGLIPTNERERSHQMIGRALAPILTAVMLTASPAVAQDAVTEAGVQVEKGGAL